MQNTKITLFSIVFSTLLSIAYATESKSEPNMPTTLELLEKYAENQDKINSYQIIADISLIGATNRPPATGKVLYNFYRTETCFDGNRLSFKLDRWMNMSTKPEDTSSLSKNYEHFIHSRLLWDGENNYTFSKDNKLVGPLKIDKNFTNNDVQDMFRYNSPEAILFGIFPLDSERIDKVLKNQALDRKVRYQKEEVGKFNCYVIDATTETTEYTLWLAPEYAYNIVKAYHRSKSPETSFDAHSVLTVKHLEKINDIWFPMEAASEGGATWGEYYSKGTMDLKRTKVVLDPNHDELQSFELDEVPNGMKTLIVGIQDAYTWQDGKVVDKNGKVILDCTVKTKEEAKTSKSDSLDYVLQLWSEGKEEQSVKSFVNLKWDDTLIETQNDILNMSESKFISLPSNERAKIREQSMAFTTEVRSLVKSVIQEAKESIASKNYQYAEKSLNATLKFGEYLSNLNTLEIIKMVGISVRKIALNELAKLYTETNEKEKLKNIKQQISRL